MIHLEFPDRPHGHSPDLTVTALEASEILDSRGYPTIEVTLALGGVSASASVPSGKSTGRHEARERRDADLARYGGQGVLDAVAAVNDEIAPRLIGELLPRQIGLDDALIALDGTPNKERLGANAILGVSLAAARVRAIAERQSLVHSLTEGLEPENDWCVPVPCFNVINGGAHADNLLEFQEFMIVPAGAATFAKALQAGAEVYHRLAALLEARKMSTAVGDEGGFAPAVEHPTEAIELIVEAIGNAGYRPGKDVFVALDPAANGFYRSGAYHFGGRSYDAAAMVAMYGEWLDRYPIVSIEDGLAEEDAAGWQLLTTTLGDRVQLVGDDIFVSDAARVRRGSESGIANAVLLKPNQVGTVTEIAATARVAREMGYSMMMSHRSGETSDSFIADLAVALGVGQIKAGAPARGERVAKYNRLLRLEQEMGATAPFAGIGAFQRTSL